MSRERSCSVEANTSVRERVHEEIDRHTEGVSRKLIRIPGVIRPFVGVAKVGVVIDNHHQTSVVIPYPFAFGLKAIRFPGNPAVECICQARCLYQMVDIVEHVKNRMVARNVFDFTVRKDFANLPFECRPFEATPEIIDDPESTALQVVSEDSGVVLRQDHLFDFTGVDQRVLEQVWIVNRNYPLLIGDVDVRQTFQDIDQMSVRARIVRIPVFVITGNPSVINQTGEDKLVGFLCEVVWNTADIVVAANKPEVRFFLCINNGGSDGRRDNDQADEDSEALKSRTAILSRAFRTSRTPVFRSSPF